MPSFEGKRKRRGVLSFFGGKGGEKGAMEEDDPTPLPKPVRVWVGAVAVRGNHYTTRTHRTANQENENDNDNSILVEAQLVVQEELL